MKFICLKCDEAMVLKKVDEDGDASIGMQFVCEKCSGGFSMMTNPMETQVVKSMGPKIEVKAPEPSQSGEGGESPAGQEGGVKWDPAAEQRLQNVPTMARSMARDAIEKRAQAKGIKLITTDFMDEVKKDVMD